MLCRLMVNMTHLSFVRSVVQCCWLLGNRQQSIVFAMGGFSTIVLRSQTHTLSGTRSSLHACMCESLAGKTYCCLSVYDILCALLVGCYWSRKVTEHCKVS